MKKYFRADRKGSLMIVMLVVMLAAVNLLGCSSVKEESLWETLSAYKGYSRTVSQEEYDFYEYFVERDLPNGVTDEELSEKVKAYVNQVNAAFYLGNKIGVHEPYSFNLLQIRMEQENENRKLKLEQGEVVYGLEQFDLNSYFQYELSNLEVDIQSYILENCDSQLRKDAEKYYDSNKESFMVREEVEYQETINGETETIVADRTQLDFLGNADMGLADFLESAEVNDTYEDVQSGEQRTVVVTGVQYSEMSFAENAAAVIENYIGAEYYPALIEEIAKNNPVEFDLNE